MDRTRCAGLALVLCAGALALSACAAGRARQRELAAVAGALDMLNAALDEWMLCMDELGLEEIVRRTGSTTPCEFVIEEGDSAVGTVRVIGQYHGTDPERSAVQGEEVVRYQLTMLRELLEAGPRAVFVEGQAAGAVWPLDDGKRSLLRESFHHVPDPDSFPSGLDTRQFEILRRTLTTAVLEALRPEVLVRGADDTAAARRMLADPLASMLDDSLSVRRERVAMETVCAWLADHPGATAHLVFGAAHVFDRSTVPAGRPVPRIVMTIYSGLMAAAISTQPFVVERLQARPPLLGRYLERLEYLNPECFALLPEPEQLKAMQMTFAPTSDLETEEDFVRLLRRGAKSRAVRAEIARGYKYLPPARP